MGVRAIGRVALLVVAIVLSAASAHADDTSRVAAATLLFDEGVRALDAGRLEEACTKLAKSQELAPSGGTLLALGECHERAGRIASAWVAYRGAASRAAAARKADAEAAALEQAARLEPQLARLTITTAAGVPANVEVSRDSGPVASLEMGIAIPVDPGLHKISATGPGLKPWAKEIEVPPGASVTLEVPPLEPERPSPLGGEEQGDHAGSTQRVLGIAAGGVGAGAIVAGSVFGILAISTNHAAEKNCPTTDCRTQDDVDEFKRANDYATVSTIAFIAGGALLVGGAVLYFTAPSPRKSAYFNPWTGTWRW